MSNIQTGAERMPHDLSHLGFLAGQIGRLITISTTPVIAGDSFEMDAVGALRLSPLRRGLAIDSTVDIFTFYVPHRHVYGEQWIKFMKDGVNATPLPTVNTTGYIDHAAFLGTIAEEFLQPHRVVGPQGDVVVARVGLCAGQERGEPVGPVDRGELDPGGHGVVGPGRGTGPGPGIGAGSALLQHSRTVIGHGPGPPGRGPATGVAVLEVIAEQGRGRGGAAQADDESGQRYGDRGGEPGEPAPDGGGHGQPLQQESVFLSWGRRYDTHSQLSTRRRPDRRMP